MNAGLRRMAGVRVLERSYSTAEVWDMDLSFFDPDTPEPWRLWGRDSVLDKDDKGGPELIETRPFSHT